MAEEEAARTGGDRDTAPTPAAPTPTYMAAVGSVTAFRPESENIASYLERVELYFTANNFPAERKVPALLSIIGANTYEVLRSLLAPDLPQNKSYGDLVRKLKEHHAQKASCDSGMIPLPPKSTARGRIRGRLPSGTQEAIHSLRVRTLLDSSVVRQVRGRFEQRGHSEVPLS